MLPQLAQVAQGVSGRGADDEAVGHVPDARGGRRSEREAPGLRVRHPHRGLERGRALLHLVEEACEVRCQVVERAARGRHVHEPEQGGAKLGVGGGHLHRPVVERADGVARVRGETGGKRATDLLHLLFEIGSHDPYATPV